MTQFLLESGREELSRIDKEGEVKKKWKGRRASRKGTRWKLECWGVGLDLCKCLSFMQCCNDMRSQHILCEMQFSTTVCLHREPYQIQDITARLWQVFSKSSICFSLQTWLLNNPHWEKHCTKKVSRFYFSFFHEQSIPESRKLYLYCSTFPLGETEGSGRRRRGERVVGKTETQESKVVKQTVRGNKVNKEASVGGKVKKVFLCFW